MSTPASDVHERLRTNGKGMKMALWRLLSESIKKYNSVEHLQRPQFSFTKTNEYLSVSKNRESLSLKIISLCFKPLAFRCLLF